MVVTGKIDETVKREAVVYAAAPTMAAVAKQSCAAGGTRKLQLKALHVARQQQNTRLFLGTIASTG